MTKALRCVAPLLMLLATPLAAQGGGGAAAGAQTPMREAQQLDLEGRHAEARAIFQRLIDGAADPAARAVAQRRMAMSWAFEGNCAKAIEYEQQVIGYWESRRAAEPQNAHYQEGEMANEAARVCIDAGALDLAEQWYRKGSELGNQEPAPRTHPQSLWDYRLAHALARIAARRNQPAEAARYVAAARRALDSDTAMARQQERFFPYLVGYVALYTGDLPRAEAELIRATQANPNDPYMHYLLADTYERLGQVAVARQLYQKAYDLATAHNPPAAFTRPHARAKLSP